MDVRVPSSGVPADGSASWIEPAVVTDPSDPKLAHLDGLNLSRAWMLEGIAAGLPSLGSFAVYFVTRRGLPR